MNQADRTKPPSSPPKKNPQTVLKIFLAICFVVAIISLCIPKKKNYTYITQEGSLERNVENTFLKTINEQIISINKSYDLRKNNLDYYIVELNYRTDHHSKILLLSDAIKFLSTIFTEPQNNQILVFNLRPHSVFIDQYGKEFEDMVAAIQLNRTMAAKINWPNMDFELFERLLSSENLIWFHRCLKN